MQASYDLCLRLLFLFSTLQKQFKRGTQTRPFIDPFFSRICWSPISRPAVFQEHVRIKTKIKTRISRLNLSLQFMTT